MKYKFVRGRKNSTYVKMAIIRKRAWVGVVLHTIQVTGAFERVDNSGSFFYFGSLMLMSWLQLGINHNNVSGYVLLK